MTGGATLSEADIFAGYTAEHSDARFTGWLRTELNREGVAAASRQQKRLNQLFQRTVSLEVAFFEGAYADATNEDERDGTRGGV